LDLSRGGLDEERGLSSEIYESDRMWLTPTMVFMRAFFAALVVEARILLSFLFDFAIDIEVLVPLALLPRLLLLELPVCCWEV